MKILVFFALFFILLSISPFAAGTARAQTYSALVAEKTATSNYIASPTVENKNILLSAMNTVNTQAAAPGNVPGASNAQAIEQAAVAAYNNTPTPAANVNSMASSTESQVVQTAVQTASTPTTPAATTVTAAPAATPANAGANFVPLTNIPAITGFQNASNLTGFFNNLYKICVGVAATLAVLQIIRAGFMYMGGDSVTETKQARALIVTALGGLALVLSPVILFSIINPKILNLQVGFSSLTPSIANTPSAQSTAAAANPRCTNTVTNPTWESLPSGGSCSGTIASSSELLDPVCCAGTQQPGAVCCGTNTLYVAPVTPALLSANQFSIAYQSTDDNGKACLAYSDQGNFANQAACITAFNKVIAATKVAYAIAESCTDSGSHTPTGAGWSTLQSLSVCPAQ